MQKFDFTYDGDVAEAVYDAMQNMSGSEIAKVHEAIFRIKEEEKKEREEKLPEWFETTIAPVLKSVAKSIDAVLEIEIDPKEITATIKKEGGLEIGMDANPLRMALYMADGISIEEMNEECWFALIYKTEHLLK